MKAEKEYNIMEYKVMSSINELNLSWIPFAGNNDDTDITFSYKINGIDATTDEINEIQDGKWFNKKVCQEIRKVIKE